MSARALIPAEVRQTAIRRSYPDWTPPQLAVLTDERFSDPDWIYERKLDGERALAFVRRGAARLMTRNRKSLDATYPELTQALAETVPHDCVLDGEIVAFDGDVTSFPKLQRRMQINDREAAMATGVEVYLYLFDILHFDGLDLSESPLRARKRLLKDAVAWRDPIRFTPHRNADGEAFFREACAKGWEGIIAKRGDSPYRHKRSRDWLKFKCAVGQELVIGGFTEPRGTRKGIGAVLVGHYDREGRLRYAGKVGSGFDRDTLAELRERLDAMRRPDSPFAGDAEDGDAIWVEPGLVAEIGFSEWTGSGKLRHPSFKGLRDDKDPKEVHREDE